MSFVDNQYNNPLVAGGFQALGTLLGREKACLSDSMVRQFTQKLGSIPNPTAVIIGGGTGWEILTLSKLGVKEIGFFEPADAMRARAETLVLEHGIQGVRFFGADNLQSLSDQFGGRANWVQSCHVLPALDTQEKLLEHFVLFEKFLRRGGHGCAFTNDPEHQFYPHETYRCSFLDPRPNTSASDGMKILATILDVTIGGSAFTDPTTGQQHTVGGQHLEVEDRFWSSATIIGAMREAGLQVGDRLAIYLREADQKIARSNKFNPYTGFTLTKT
jgi:hypothetical protein